ncbi:MAG: hypothetical protein ACTSQE_16110 [Candidatus Heimdallarchaeaceae archaeon]
MSVGSSFKIETIGTWDEGYRPTKCRVTGEYYDEWTIALYDSNDGLLGSATVTGPSITFDLSFGSYDIDWLNIATTYTNVTNIEFYI